MTTRNVADGMVELSKSPDFRENLPQETITQTGKLHEKPSYAFLTPNAEIYLERNLRSAPNAHEERVSSARKPCSRVSRAVYAFYVLVVVVALALRLIASLIPICMPILPLPPVQFTGQSGQVGGV
ncbi:hypothetical protein GQ44DRAFT_833080 [Phaeosphaeriaceae sp. PMI808]|nr:hypothetical protein GQ44DRAFT_833141 [Phaeosphaeriaceae sp. PMI808]KAH8689773.1 hypothetical protein GQ44DRAFT_833080 [Phaeosphaeriaceae sp. PMI808]